MTEDDYILVANLTALRCAENAFSHALFMNEAEKQKFDVARRHLAELRLMLEKQIEVE